MSAIKLETRGSTGLTYNLSGAAAASALARLGTYSREMGSVLWNLDSCTLLASPG